MSIKKINNFRCLKCILTYVVLYSYTGNKKIGQIYERQRNSEKVS